MDNPIMEPEPLGLPVPVLEEEVAEGIVTVAPRVIPWDILKHCKCVNKYTLEWYIGV